MISKLKGKGYADYSKSDVISILQEYLKECKGVCQKDNLDDEDFNSPSWALKQAHNNGMIKLINKITNFLPENKDTP